MCQHQPFFPDARLKKKLDQELFNALINRFQHNITRGSMTNNSLKNTESPGEQKADSGSVNRPSLHKHIKRSKKTYAPHELVNGILSEDRVMLGKAITLVESALFEDQQLAHEIIEQCLPHSGKSIRIGITGVPGSGKSTFIESFGLYLLDRNNKVAVLAIDPSSEISRGSILGDKTRMEDLSKQAHAFIRPSPTAGTLGGVARKTRETIILCEAAGFDTIIIETVGVGQSETMVHSMVDFFLLLMLAGAGDELQGIKRGIVEMADLLAITKADGSNKDKAEKAKTEYENALHLFPPADSGWIPRVVTCSALENRGIDTIWANLNEYLKLTRENGFFEKERKQQDVYWIHASLQEMIKSDFYNTPAVNQLISDYEKKVRNGTLSPFLAARKLYEHFK